MPATVSRSPLPWPLLIVGLFGGLLCALAGGLWVYFGTTVFFEMVRTGWIACF